MALSEQEQRMLAEIERALIAEDPRLAQRAATGESPTLNVNLQAIALIFLGLLGLIGGIALAQQSLWFVALSVVGFFVMFGGGLLTLRGSQKVTTQRGRKTRSAQTNAKAQNSSGRIGDRMEDNFRKRFER